MKKFHHGRTETLRTVFDETQALVRCMKEDARPAIVRQAMANLTKAHGSRIQQCRSGMGYHRHFTSFRAVHQHTVDRLTQQLNASTTDERRRRIERWLRAAEEVQREWIGAQAIRELASDYLSTSAIAFPGVNYFSFGAVLPDGIGVGYSPFPNELRFSIAAFTYNKRPDVGGGAPPGKDSATRFSEKLKEAVKELFDACSEHQGQAASKL
jgi:hypothetical protein